MLQVPLQEWEVDLNGNGNGGHGYARAALDEPTVRARLQR